MQVVRALSDMFRHCNEWQTPHRTWSKPILGTLAQYWSNPHTVMVAFLMVPLYRSILMEASVRFVRNLWQSGDESVKHVFSPWHRVFAAGEEL